MNEPAAYLLDNNIVSEMMLPELTVPQDAPVDEDRALDNGTVQGVRQDGTQAWRDPDIQQDLH